MKVGYFTHSDKIISETFIFDLIVGLDKVLNLTFFNGQKQNSINIIKSQIALNYSNSSSKLPFILFKLGQIFGSNGYRLKGRFNEKHAYQSLNKKKINIDFAIVDYANTGVLLMNYFKNNNIPFIVNVHGFDITSELNDPYYKKRLLILFKLASNFIVASNHMRRLLVLLGCEPLKIKLVRYGISDIKLHSNHWISKLKTNPRLVFIGRLTEKKHPLALVHAFNIVNQKFSDATLDIIGDGQLKIEVINLIKKFGLENKIKMHGSLERKDAFKILRKSWIYVQHSVSSFKGDQEGYGISISEAAMHELPIVSTLHNGIPEQVINNRTGFLVNEFDFENMAEKIIHLINNPKLMKQFGENGRINIKKINNVDLRINKINNLIGNLKL